MVTILWQSASTYLRLFPHLIKGKRGFCLFSITPRSSSVVGRQSLKAILEGRQQLILVKSLGFKPQLEFSLGHRPTSGVPIILPFLGNLTEAQGGGVPKRFQPNTGTDGGHLCRIISRTSCGEGLGEPKVR